jgi:hypothetical protein
MCCGGFVLAGRAIAGDSMIDQRHYSHPFEDFIFSSDLILSTGQLLSRRHL